MTLVRGVKAGGWEARPGAGGGMMATIKRMWGRLRRALGVVGPIRVGTGGARDPNLSSLGGTDHGRSNPAAADCTGVDGRPLASILTPGEVEAGLRPGDHRFLAR